MQEEEKLETAHRINFNLRGVGSDREIDRENSLLIKSNELEVKISQLPKIHTALPELNAVWEHILFLEKTVETQNSRIGQLEQKQEQTANSRKLYATSLIDRKQKIADALRARKCIDVEEIKQMLHLTSQPQALKIMKEVAKDEKIAFIVGRSRVPSKLVTTDFTNQEIKDTLVSRMPFGASILLSRIQEQFFVEKMQLPELVRFLAPQFKYCNWKDGARVERVK